MEFIPLEEIAFRFCYKILFNDDKRLTTVRLETESVWYCTIKTCSTVFRNKSKWLLVNHSRIVTPLLIRATFWSSFTSACYRLRIRKSLLSDAWVTVEMPSLKDWVIIGKRLSWPSIYGTWNRFYVFIYNGSVRRPCLRFRLWLEYESLDGTVMKQDEKSTPNSYTAWTLI